MYRRCTSSQAECGPTTQTFTTEMAARAAASRRGGPTRVGAFIACPACLAPSLPHGPRLATWVRYQRRWRRCRMDSCCAVQRCPTALLRFRRPIAGLNPLEDCNDYFGKSAAPLSIACRRRPLLQGACSASGRQRQHLYGCWPVAALSTGADILATAAHACSVVRLWHPGGFRDWRATSGGGPQCHHPLL